MSYEKITENVENIGLLPDTPAMSSTELKAEFDKGNKTIKEKFNKLIDDLNGLNDNIFEKNIITAHLPQTIFNISVNNTKINLAEHKKVGDKLTVSNNDIVIGAGVSCIKVSAAVFYQGFDKGTGYLFPSINKNNNIVARGITQKGASGSADYQSVNIAEILIDVQEGDKISLNAGDINNVECEVRGTDSNNRLHTYITVEVVE